MNAAIAAVRNSVSAEEWQTRVDLAACYRLVARYGWSDLVFTHVSARVPGAQEHFLINPYGLLSRKSPPPAWSRSTPRDASSTIRRGR